MTKDNSSLGKGLGSLLGDRPKQQASGLMEIATEDLTPGQYKATGCSATAGCKKTGLRTL